MGACVLAPFRRNLDQTRYFMLQLLDDRRTVGFVLYEFGSPFGPLLRHDPDGLFGLWHIHSFAALIQQESVGTLGPPHLPDHVVTGRLILESQVPRLYQAVELLRPSDRCRRPERLAARAGVWPWSETAPTVSTRSPRSAGAAAARGVPCSGNRRSPVRWRPRPAIPPLAWAGIGPESRSARRRARRQTRAGRPPFHTARLRKRRCRSASRAPRRESVPARCRLGRAHPGPPAAGSRRCGRRPRSTRAKDCRGPPLGRALYPVLCRCRWHSAARVRAQVGPPEATPPEARHERAVRSVYRFLSRGGRSHRISGGVNPAARNSPLVSALRTPVSAHADDNSTRCDCPAMKLLRGEAAPGMAGPHDG